VGGVAHSSVCATDEGLVDGLVAVLDAGERSDGRKRIDEFSLDRMTRDLLGVYEDILDDFSRGQVANVDVPTSSDSVGGPRR
jgi:hypothetical protein